ncbi:MAG: putative rane protein [Geobacteraceae bacterium]|nr:putative rane protein [Geobacteraceae bacterium]
MRVVLLIVVMLSVFSADSFADDALKEGRELYSQGGFRKAAQVFGRFVSSHPDDAEGYAWLGKSYYRQGDNVSSTDPQVLEKAAEVLRKSVTLDPGHSEARFYLGMTYLSLNDRAGALKEYETLRIDRNGRDLAEQLHQRILSHSTPPSYRAVHEKGDSVTPVKIVGNQVLVPVILEKNATEVQAVLLLDTGATVTSIHSDVAARLNVGPGQARKTKGQVAGGGVLDVWRTKLTRMTVGPHTKTDTDVAILEHRGPRVMYDGLLGMNFLRNLRYVIDFRNQTINWEP